MERDVKYKAQDLVFALLKIKKYQTDHYKRLYDDLIKGKSFDNMKYRIIWLLFRNGKPMYSPKKLFPSNLFAEYY